jgi:acyl-CoA synthetase (AMP-forming)/AMP-acid ligase II
MLPMVCHLPLVMQSPTDWVMDPGTMLQAVSQHKCTLAWMPNFAFQFVPRRTRLERFDSQPDLSSVRALINCSEPVRASSMQEFADAFASIGLKPGVLQSSYAMAENVFAITQSRANVPPVRIWVDGREFRAGHHLVPVAESSSGALCFVSSGRLLPNHQIRIVDEAGSELPSGGVGEILVQSDCLFSEYFNRPDLTQRAIIDDWYHTGDLGFLVDGELFVVGRKKDLIIVAGENLYPQDIEEIIAAHPAVHDGRVVAAGAYNPETGTEDIIVVAEVETEELLASAASIEQELRESVMRSMGVAAGLIYLKPPKWIVKSTAGKPARSATFEKLKREHPELAIEN